jgi:cyanophycin synthetase
VDVVLADGAAVLNAADEGVAAMAPLCDGEVILYGQDSTLPAIVAHRAEGGRAVYVRHGYVMLAAGTSETPVAELRTLTFRHGRQAPEAAGILLAGIAAAWALDISPDLIVAGIETFEPEPAALRASPEPAAVH